MDTQKFSDTEAPSADNTLLSALAYRYFDEIQEWKDFPAEEKAVLLAAVKDGTCTPQNIMELIPSHHQNLVGVFLRRLDRREFHPVEANILAHKHKGRLQEWKFAQENFPRLLVALEDGTCNMSTIAGLIPGKYAKAELMEFLGNEETAYEYARTNGLLNETREHVQKLLNL